MLALAEASDEKRLAALVDLVRSDVARVLAIGRMGAVPAEKPLRDLGLDSLLAVELRNTLGRRLGVALPPTLTFEHPTPLAIATFLMKRVGGAAPAARAPAAATSPANGDTNGRTNGRTNGAANSAANGAHGSAATSTALAPVAEAPLAREDRVDRIPMGERWFTDAFRVIPSPGGFAQRGADVTFAMQAVQILNQAGIRGTITHVMMRAAALALARNPHLHKMVCGYRTLSPGQVDIGMSMLGKTAFAPVVVLPASDRTTLGDMVPMVEEAIVKAHEKEDVDLANLKKVGWTTPIGFLRRFTIRILQEMFWFRRKLVGTFQVTAVPTAEVCAPLQFYTGSILSFGRPRDTVVAIDGRPAVRPVVTMTVVVDHVVHDGMQAAALVNEIASIVESEELVDEARRAASAVLAPTPGAPKALPPPTLNG